MPETNTEANIRKINLFKKNALEKLQIYGDSKLAQALNTKHHLTVEQMQFNNALEESYKQAQQAQKELSLQLAKKLYNEEQLNEAIRQSNQLAKEKQEREDHKIAEQLAKQEHESIKNTYDKKVKEEFVGTSAFMFSKSDQIIKFINNISNSFFNKEAITDATANTINTVSKVLGTAAHFANGYLVKDFTSFVNAGINIIDLSNFMKPIDDISPCIKIVAQNTALAATFAGPWGALVSGTNTAMSCTMKNYMDIDKSSWLYTIKDSLEFLDTMNTMYNMQIQTTTLASQIQNIHMPTNIFDALLYIKQSVNAMELTNKVVKMLDGTELSNNKVVETLDSAFNNIYGTVSDTFNSVSDYFDF